MVSVIYKCQFQNHVFITTVFYTPMQTKHRPMDALVINIVTQALISQKITRQKKKIKTAEKGGPAKTIFGQKSGPAMAGPAVPPTTALGKYMVKK